MVMSLWRRFLAHPVYFVLTGCGETRTVSARLVLNTCIPVRSIIREFSVVQFMSGVPKKIKRRNYENQSVLQAHILSRLCEHLSSFSYTNYIYTQFL